MRLRDMESSMQASDAMMMFVPGNYCGIARGGVYDKGGKVFVGRGYS